MAVLGCDKRPCIDSVLAVVRLGKAVHRLGLVALDLAFGPCIGGQNLPALALEYHTLPGAFNKVKNYDKIFPAMNFNGWAMKM